MSVLDWIFHSCVLAGLIFAVIMVGANLACFDGLRPSSHYGPDAPRVSILVPARNEAFNIEACITSLLSQNYPNFELLVMDDHSDDATVKILRGLGLSETGELHRLFHSKPLPEGWTGKAWACHQLAKEARGDFLWFTDADTRHEPGTLAAAVAYARRTRAGLVSAWPRLVTETFGERLVIPIILLLAMTICPYWIVFLLQHRPRLARLVPEKIRRLLGAANGQFLFFSRDCYDRIGGHAAVADHLVEDLALGRAVAARMHEGLRLFNCDAVQFSQCRMYCSLREVWEGFTKNVRPAFERSAAGFVGVGAFLFFCFLWPCLAVLLPLSAKSLIIAAVLIIFLLRVLLTVRFQTSWLSCLLHPIGLALSLAIGLHSWWRTVYGGVSWKGRKYVGSLGSNV